MDSCNPDAGFEGQDGAFPWFPGSHRDDAGSHDVTCQHRHHDQFHRQSQPGGEPMDVDFDVDSLSWTDELDHTFAAVDLDLGLDLHEPSAAQHQPGFGAVPLDFLFAEDETAFPSYVAHDQLSDAHVREMSSDSNGAMMLSPITHCPWQSPDVLALNSEDPAPERLRSQLSLLSEGSCGDELVFKKCDASKAVLLHGLAIDFGLNYGHDAASGEVTITRPTNSNSGTLSFHSKAPSIVLTSPFESLSFASRASIDTDSLMEGTPSILSPPPIDRTSQQLSRRPSRSQRISDSISKHVSTWKTSMSKSGGGRRGPLTEDGRRDMKVLEVAGGACWRCKVLRRKCDPGSPCRCCLQSVPMPHLGDDAPLWPLIGCRRGPLRDALPVQVLCPALRRDAKMDVSEVESDYRVRRSLDLADRCLLSAEGQRLADMKAVLEGASYKLSIPDTASRRSFVSFVENGRYRNQESLHKTLILEEKPLTYAEMIATIGWELAENHGVLQLLEMKSWEEFMNMLETACIYESEVGQTSLVMISMVCLRHCLEALRLHSAGLLVEDEHIGCKPGLCQVQCIQDLSYYIEAYVTELSSVVFNKENMRDRRWWLSTFYSLCLQSYVRHALVAIEKQLRFGSADDVSAEDLTGTQYLHLAAILFTAASAKYDPLLGGRLQYALTENSVIPETSVPELHHSSARAACEVEKWPEVGVKTSYQFLRRLLQIGSLDFEQEQNDLQPIRTSISSGRLTPDTLRPATASRYSIGGNSSSGSLQPSGEVATQPLQQECTDDVMSEAVSSPKKQAGNKKRWSAETGYSLWSATSVSNASSLSLARTFQSDVTSIHEVCEDEMGDGFAAPDDTRLEPLQEVPQISASESSTGMAMSGSSCFVCHCCPRTPQRFRTAEELTKHETEKPYPCARCKRRFKSPAEADRHTKAVHIKSHYWTCKAMENPFVVFDQEVYEDGTYDICGFCGGGFLRSGKAAESEDSEEHRVAELVSHLEKVHHYGECNREKEFYRVDNFRQHLKTTHVAKQGKWLKDLEAKCRTTTKGGQGGVNR